MDDLSGADVVPVAGTVEEGFSCAAADVVVDLSVEQVFFGADFFADVLVDLVTSDCSGIESKDEDRDKGEVDDTGDSTVFVPVLVDVVVIVVVYRLGTLVKFSSLLPAVLPVLLLMMEGAEAVLTAIPVTTLVLFGSCVCGIRVSIEQKGIKCVEFW